MARTGLASRPRRSSAPDAQLSFLPSEGEDPRYLTEQLITYIGNKRSLLSPIVEAVSDVRARMGRKLRILDGFSGSGVVARALRQHASELVVNDTETYSRVVNACYQSNRSVVPIEDVAAAIRELNGTVDSACGRAGPGFIQKMYSPCDDTAIQSGERVFYTTENGRRLDLYRQSIEKMPEKLRPFLLAPLLSAASVHANTSGVFKGFYKDASSGVGKFGGTGADALSRILRPIQLNEPVFSRFELPCEVTQLDANALVSERGGFDLAYFDPPYNQHPYGSNYFMLNLLAEYVEPTDVSKVSGIPVEWNRSGYNVRSRALPLLRDLLEQVDAAFILLSFNNEGFVTPSQLHSMLNELGKVDVVEVKYNTFRGSRNLRARSTHVTEQLFLVEKG